MELLHIYAQDSWHQEATIVGNREGLTRLMGAIQKLLEQSPGAQLTTDVFVNDGEGYECRVMWLEHPDTWKLVARPYSDPDCQGTNAGKVYP